MPQPRSFDPILRTDPDTGRTFTSQLLLACGQGGFTDDDGRSFTLSQGCGPASAFDHQTVGFGPYVKGSPLAALKNLSAETPVRCAGVRAVDSAGPGRQRRRRAGRRPGRPELAASAADLAALTAAGRAITSPAEARRAAARTTPPFGAQLYRCTVTGAVVDAEVVVRPSGALGRLEGGDHARPGRIRLI